MVLKPESQAVQEAETAFREARQTWMRLWRMFTDALSAGRSGTAEREKADDALLESEHALKALTAARQAQDAGRDRRAERYDGLVAALEAVEWLPGLMSGVPACPYCGRQKGPRHTLACIVGNALAEARKVAPK